MTRFHLNTQFFRRPMIKFEKPSSMSRIELEIPIIFIYDYIRSELIKSLNKKLNVKTIY